MLSWPLKRQEFQPNKVPRDGPMSSSLIQGCEREHRIQNSIEGLEEYIISIAGDGVNGSLAF